MIYIRVVRTCWCCVCDRFWDLDRGEPAPKACPLCGSVQWDGVLPRGQLAIRQGRAYAREVQNPGAVSLKRREQGRRQYRRFKSKENQE